jgi:hypothetical protein
MTDKSSAITSGIEISFTTLKKDLPQFAKGSLPQEYKGMLTHIENPFDSSAATDELWTKYEAVNKL